VVEKQVDAGLGTKAARRPISSCGSKRIARVPLILWASDRYLAEPVNRQKFEAGHANQDRSVSHDFVFHTVLDLAGVESEEVLRPELTLVRPLPRDVERPTHALATASPNAG